MRSSHLMPVSLLALAACSGGGPQTVSSTAAPVSAGTSTHSFVAPTEAKTYSAIGGVQKFTYSTDERGTAGQYSQLYAGDATTARNSGITVTYDPRDAIFEIKIADTAAGASDTLRFQDPLHRTDFGGLREPQDGVPDLNKNVQYLQAGGQSGVTYDPAQSDTFPVGDSGGSRDVSTFFYQKPGTSTKYVTFAGFVRNATTISTVTPTDGTASYLRQDNILERGVFAYGERTDNNAVPKTGTGTYTGDMVASVVYNPRPDASPDAPSYFQWINGTSNVTIDFAASSVKTSFAGTVSEPTYDVYTSRTHDLPAGSTFAATGTAAINLVNAGGFVGQIDSASFTKPNGAKAPITIAGSSLDGAFYGPKGEEIGGGFRVVGGTPDQRIDILGTFTGASGR